MVNELLNSQQTCAISLFLFNDANCIWIGSHSISNQLQSVMCTHTPTEKHFLFNVNCVLFNQTLTDMAFCLLKEGDSG